MAKKKKKMIKLNQSIRHFFGDEGFDEGIERVPTETLIALSHTLGLFNDITDKPTLVRNFRRLWSEGESDNREYIVDFFRNDQRTYPNPKPKEKPHEREEKIDELLEGMDINPSERLALHSAFIDVRIRKITPEKIASKLEHIRVSLKRERLEKALEGKFNYDDSLEFYASIQYAIGNEQFTKIHVLKTPPIENQRIQEEAPEILVEEISKLKIALMLQKQEQINQFLAAIPLRTHRYLSEDEIISALKSAPPSASTITNVLDNELLQKVLSTYFPSAKTSLRGDDLMIEIQKSLNLPHSSTPFHYTLHLHLDALELSRNIWEGNEITFAEVTLAQTREAEQIFLSELSDLIRKCDERAKLLNLSETRLYELVYELLAPHFTDTLHIGAKTQKRVLYAFDQLIATELLKRQRQELLARSIRDFKNLFPLARSLRRKLVFHIGPTNSGKTYTAMEKLRSVGTGYYLAPLRLLALEGYESLRDEGINASLITGEEQILDEDATHISSTIEMLNFEVEVDACVIDEVQMIGDRDRGWAWANAIIGAPAKTVIMTGSTNALEAISALAQYLGEPLEIIEFERKNPLELMKGPVPLTKIEPKTAIIAFSRSSALRIKQQISSTYKTSIIYGNLSPEVRREEARRFREGETDILVATDAIAMGLNLPIKTLLFSKADKFDGQSQRDLTASEVQQIAGRAGRYGLSEQGYVGAVTNEVLKKIGSLFTQKAQTISVPFNVMANFDHIMLVSTILEEKSLSAIIEFFVENMKFEGPFRAANLESMSEASAIADRYDLDMKTKFTLATAPLSTGSPLVMAAFERYVKALEQGKPIAYVAPSHLGAYALTMEDLQDAEDRIKEISLYLWLSYRLSEYFIDSEKARSFRGELNRFIENSLKQSHFTPRCKTCSKPLAPGSEFSICQSCFNALNRSKNRATAPRPPSKAYKRS
ncbi:MAG: SUV3 C-terminal domain-containing protein [Sulfuricurvum sp.]|nr:SUV3 C-terminal domain-containing protein [Sulfuricurvum sp.]